MTTALAKAQLDVATYVDALHTDGITALKGGLTRQFVEHLREDMMSAYWEAIQRPGGAVGRGPRRWYVETHPQAFRGFVELITHPWVRAMCEAVLGPEYEIVEVGLDVSIPGREVPALAP